MSLGKLINILKYISRNYSDSELLDGKEIIKRIHYIMMMNCKGKTCRRKVKVKANGQWFFMKMTKYKKR